MSVDLSLMKNAFKNRKQAYKDSAENGKGGGTSSKYLFFDQKQTEMKIRLYPYANPDDPFAMGTMRAWHMLSSEDNSPRYYCPVHCNPYKNADAFADFDPEKAAELEKENNEVIKEKRKCPFCETVSSLWADGDEAPEEVKNLRSLIKARKKWYYLAVDRNKESEGIKIYAAGIKIKEQIDNWFYNDEYMAEDMTSHIFHKEQGYDLTIKRVKNGKWWDYTIVPSRTSSPLGTTEQIATWEEQIANDSDLDLHSNIGKNLKNYDELVEILNNPNQNRNSQPSAVNMDKLMNNFSGLSSESNSDDKSATSEQQESTPSAEPKAETTSAPESNPQSESEAEMRARIEAEMKAKMEAEAKAKIEAEMKAKMEAETKAKMEAETKKPSDDPLAGMSKPKSAPVSETSGDDLDAEFESLINESGS
jgi:hypothetical protein